MKLKSLLVLAFALLLSACQTTFYKDGHKIASFAGDMTDSRVEISESGAVRWSAAKVNHSKATKAAGKAVTNTTSAVAAGATAVMAPSFIK